MGFTVYDNRPYREAFYISWVSTISIVLDEATSKSGNILVF